MNYNEAAMACFRIYPSTCLKGVREITKNFRLVYRRTDKFSDFEKWKRLARNIGNYSGGNHKGSFRVTESGWKSQGELGKLSFNTANIWTITKQVPPIQ
jgi:hypothetical protein